MDLMGYRHKEPTEPTSAVDPTRTSSTKNCALCYTQINGMDRDSILLSR